MLRSVLIVGLGLMGSNLGLKLRSQGIKVYGEEIDENAHARAINSGVIEKTPSLSVQVSIHFFFIFLSNLFYLATLSDITFLTRFLTSSIVICLIIPS